MRPIPTFLALIFLLQVASPLENTVLLVHEWGTFTSLQDELGNTIGGINTDDEPVPSFVHTLRGDLLIWPTDLPNSYFGKGFPRLHPDVTMRLETPVMYFYPPAGSVTPMIIDVRASFRGGWLTEYYPRAQPEAPGMTVKLDDGNTALGGIDQHTMGALTWRGLQVGVNSAGPETDAEVWLAPRRVRAVSVATPDGESEKYLFYRGVGHMDGLLRIHRSVDDSWLELRSQPPADPAAPSGLVIRSSWLVHIRDDGRTAYRHVGSLETGDENEILATVLSVFAETDYSSSNLSQLRQAMHQALVVEGLFDDEATAMLDTWQEAFFQSSGLRLFYTVPQEWTDYYLPLEFSEPVELTRVMMGRIEIVTVEQRDLLARISTLPVEPFPSKIVGEVLKTDREVSRRVRDGRMALTDLDVPLPESFVAYLGLGRFRNALILHELQQRPSPGLEDFITQYRLTGYRVPEGVVRDPFRIAPLPPADLAILDDVLADGWLVERVLGVEDVDLDETEEVYSGDRANAFQVRDSFSGWILSYKAPEPVDPYGYSLRFAIRPGEVSLPANPRFSVILPPGRGVNLLTGGQVDLTRQEWQVVELPIATKDFIGAVNFAGNFGGSFYLDDLRLVTAARPPTMTAIEEDDSGAIPVSASLEQNYPNPFNPETTIQYSLPRAGYIDVSVFGLTGQKVASLVSRTQPAGTHRLQWDGRDDEGRELASGVYLYRLRAGTTVQSRKLLLLR